MKFQETAQTRFYLGLVAGFLLGVFVATLATGNAQLAPFDAPLSEQLSGQRAEHWLRSERAIERWESSVYRDPGLNTFGTPCRK